MEKSVISQTPLVFGLDIGTRSLVGTVGYKENNIFNVLGHCVVEHKTRAMLDGQIHDIPMVAASISKVKTILEEQINRPIEDVCIAAAGRVLKTISIRADHLFTEDTVISEEHVYALEILGVEKAYEEISKQNADEVKYHCVGYSVIKYYLNDYEISNLTQHKGTKISAQVLATFLPEDVIDGLYAAIQLSGLNVVSLTLEPIAAIHVAIPQQFRLLNLALVDIGAGTSDISITKDGSVVAYGMIPFAGDEITELIVHKYLVDFQTGEKIKLALAKGKPISYKDIMNITHKISCEEVLETIKPAIEKLAKNIADKIMEMNGNKTVNAVFCVGGGGKIEGLTSLLADYLGLNHERVALRGAEVLQEINIKNSIKKLKKDSLMVTPIGICLSYYQQRSNFVFVTVNGNKLKLYNTNKLSVVDAAVQIGFANQALFPRRGKDIHFTINGKPRIIRGNVGEPAKILVNHQEVSISHGITNNDIIELTPSTIGEDASLVVSDLKEFGEEITFLINNKKVTCPRLVMINQEVAHSYTSIIDHDDVQILNYYTVDQLLNYMDLNDINDITVNGEKALLTDKVYENFTIQFSFQMTKSPSVAEIIEEKEKRSILTITVSVNNQPITLNTKEDGYIFVDILDVYDFNITETKGKLVTRINGENASFTSMISQGDYIEIFWEG